MPSGKRLHAGSTLGLWAARLRPSLLSPGSRLIENANSHTWSWGSTDYDGAGSIQVFITTADFGASGTNLTRACYYASCNDQDVRFSTIWMSHYTVSGASHTIYGHAKA